MIKCSSAEALVSAKSNHHSKWVQGEESAKSRLQNAICIPHARSSFKISAEDRIFAIGSCFARNVEEQLTRHHKQPLSAEIDIPNAEILTARKTGIVNKYNSRSMVQEMSWAAGADFPKGAFLERKGGFYDPHIRSKISDCSFDELLVRREHIRSYFRKAFTADIFVLTLGLSEFWLDEATGLALNEMPAPYCLRKDPGRFSFCISQVGDVIEDLNKVRDIVLKHGSQQCRFLVTTSPVPLGRTFTDNDVITANMHSKSVLRVAALEFAQKHDDVDYYPSYEGAMLSDPRIVWSSDRLHISDFMVGKLIREFLVRYGISVPEESSDAALLNDDDIVASLREEYDRLANRIIRLENRDLLLASK